MNNKQQTVKVDFDRKWTVVNAIGGGEISQAYRTTSKSEAYRTCRRLNGKKAGGTKPYVVQRLQK